MLFLSIVTCVSLNPAVCVCVCVWCLCGVCVCVFRPSHILLSCGVPPEVASNAVRLSVGRNTSREEVEQAVQDLRAAVTTLELASMLG